LLLFYAVDLVFLWLPAPEMAVARVGERVRLGGHDVPEAVIRRRYHRGLENFFRLYRANTDQWWFLDNSGAIGPRLVACGAKDPADDVTDGPTWTNLMEEFS
jgi:predicted ABC-type ATPase